MILCDVGNTNLHFYCDGSIWDETPSELTPKSVESTIYYISVSPHNESKLLSIHPKCINLEKYIEIESEYDGLGIDRKAAISTIDNGVIVDAGSAITLDLVDNKIHRGGFIMPGLGTYATFYKNISPILSKSLNTNVDLHSLPQDTRSAISYGVLKSIVLNIETIAQDRLIYFTGGDGHYFTKFFKNSIYDSTIVFKGMMKCINDKLTKESNG